MPKVYINKNFKQDIFKMASAFDIDPVETKLILYRSERNGHNYVYNIQTQVAYIIILLDNTVNIICKNKKYATYTFQDTNDSYRFLQAITGKDWKQLTNK
jgi:hypothetical protein